MTKIFFVFSLLIECCNIASKPYPRVEDKSNNYYILERQRDNSFAVTRQCGLYSILGFNDTLLEISFHLAGAFEYRISKIDSLQNDKVITCDAEYANIGYIDTTVFVKIYYKKLDYMTTRFIMHKTDCEKKIDTMYATKEAFFNNYKLIDLECSKKAQ